jgi:hypothetical protein
MRDFRRELESQLRLAIEAQTAGRRTTERGRPLRWIPAPGRARLAGLSIALAAGAAIFAVVGAGTNPPRALALPVLARPVAAATGLSGEARAELLRRGVDLQQARSVDTVNGTGYVVPLDDGSGLCLTVPDPAGGDGQSCATTRDIQRRGLVVSIVPKNGRHVNLVVVVPTAATVVTRHRGGETTALTAVGGIVATTVDEDETVTLRIGDQEHSLTPPVNASPTAGFAACDHGARPVPIPAGMPPDQVHTLCEKQR